MRSPIHYENPSCEGSGHLFYDDSGNVNLVRQAYAQAKSMCMDCAYIDECAEWGIKYELYGIWGGLTPKERAAIRSKRGFIRQQPPGEDQVVQSLMLEIGGRE